MEKCIFCDQTLEKLLIKKFEHWIVYLNINQSYLGRVMIALNRHGVESVNDLTKDEWDEFKDVIEKVTKTLKSLYQFDLMNYAMLHNKDRNHFHMHLIPRYENSRIVHGEEFKDGLWGNTPFPSPKKELNEKILLKIKEDIQKEL